MTLVKVKHKGKDTWLDVSKIIAMCEETHSVFFECVIWQLSEKDFNNTFNNWFYSNLK